MLELLKDKKYLEIRKIVEEMNVVDLAEFIQEIEDNPKVVILFRLLPKKQAAEVFAYLDGEIRQKIVNGISDKELYEILDELFLDDAVDFIEEMPASIVKRVINTTDEETRRQINQILMFPDESAGCLMTIEYADLHSGISVEEAIKKVRRISPERESIETLFITDHERHLVGTLNIRDLLAAKDSTMVGEIMDANVISVHTHENQAEVADKFKKYDFFMMPVVDNEDRLVGMITIDDIIDVIEEETTEDIYKMAAMQPIEDSYMQTGVLTLARKRFAWLAILMISATFTGLIIEKFQSALAVNVLLATFIPMLMDTSGNAGSQSAVSVIRATVLDEIAFKDTFKVIWKEFRISMITGLGVALLNFIRVYVMYKSMPIACVVSITLFFSVVAAKIVGCTLPLIATKLKLDPAIMASPLITTIVDAVALLVYFNIAALILPGI